MSNLPYPTKWLKNFILSSDWKRKRGLELGVYKLLKRLSVEFERLYDSVIFTEQPRPLIQAPKSTVILWLESYQQNC